MLLLPIIIPLFGGFALLLLSPPWAKKISRFLVGITALLVLLLPLLQVGTLRVANFPFSVVLSLNIDYASILFSYLFVLVWWIVLRYAGDYFGDREESNRFYGFYTATLGALIGLCYANNLITLYLFFEFVGLLCVPLVAHDRSELALKASRKYLYYSVAGAFMGLTAIFYFFTLDIPRSFQAGGIPELIEQGDLQSVLHFTLLAVIGFGCKAGMFPLHAGLIAADPIAPDPATAVLSGIATKAGVIAIFRLLYYVVGPEALTGTLVQTWGLALSILTIFMGSMLAYREKILKTRLAYSTVSQVSYVIFALFLFHPMAVVGAFLQVCFHAFAKTALFLSVGTIIHETGKQRVEELGGLGHALPNTFLTFTIASFSLVGIPFTGGFVSKWYIATGASQLGGLAMTGVFVLIVSALLTAGYLLPIILGAYLVPKNEFLVYQPSKAMKTIVLPLLILLLGIFPLPLIVFLGELVDTLGLGGGL